MSADESVLALVLHLPEKMQVSMLSDIRVRTQEWLENNGLKGLPLMVTCGDMRVDVLKVKTEDLASQEDIATFDASVCKTEVEEGSLENLSKYLRSV